MEQEELYRMINEKEGALSLAFPKLMRKVYVWMTLALVITGFTAYEIAASPNLIMAIVTNRILFWGLIIAEFGLVIGLTAAINKLSLTTGTLMFVLFSVVNGATLSTIFLAYTMSSIANVFFITAGTFAVMAFIGYTTNADLTSLGKILMMGVIGLMDLLRRNAVFRKDFRGAELFAVRALFKMIEMNAVVHDLRHVLVFRKDDHTVKAGALRGEGRARHHIVRFVARFREERNSACCESLLQKRHLRRHFLRHRPAIRLVLRVEFMPERRLPDIARDREMRRLMHRQNAEHRAPVTVHQGNVQPCGIHQRAFEVRIEHTERERKGVQQE